MSIRARGKHRFGDGAEPNDLTITRRNGPWYAAVTLRVPEQARARERTANAHRGVDFGVTDWATFDNGDTIANPRFVQNELPRFALRQRERARKKQGCVRNRRLGGQIAERLEIDPSNLLAGRVRVDTVHAEGATLSPEIRRAIS
jgi:putative transposase